MSETRSASRRRRFPLRTGVVTATAVRFSACSDDGPAGPGKACVAPQSPVPTSVVEGLTLADLRVAVRNAAERNATVLPAGNTTTELHGALLTLSDNLGSAQRENACQAATKAATALARLPDDPATLPDRAALRMVLEITAIVLRSCRTHSDHHRIHPRRGEAQERHAHIVDIRGSARGYGRTHVAIVPARAAAGTRMS